MKYWCHSDRPQGTTLAEEERLSLQTQPCKTTGLEGLRMMSQSGKAAPT